MNERTLRITHRTTGELLADVRVAIGRGRWGQSDAESRAIMEWRRAAQDHRTPIRAHWLPEPRA